MSFLVTALYFVIMFAVMVGVLFICKKWVFSKIIINKFIPLAFSIVAFLAQLFLKPTNMLVQLGLVAVVIVGFMWFMDIQQTGGPKKSREKKIVMKPKAKPNRIKNND